MFLFYQHTGQSVDLGESMCVEKKKTKTENKDTSNGLSCLVMRGIDRKSENNNKALCAKKHWLDDARASPV